MKKIAIAMLFVVSCGIAANAADARYKVSLGLFDSMPMNKSFSDACKSSLGLNLSGDYMLNDRFAAGIEIGDVFGYDFKHFSSASVMPMSYGVRGKYVSPTDFGSKKGNVYGILGLAAYNWSTDPETATTTRIGYSLGAGAEVEFMPQWSVGLEARYHLVSAYGNDIGNNLNVMLNAGYSF